MTRASKGFNEAYERFAPPEQERTVNPLLDARVDLATIIREGAPPPDEQQKNVLIKGAAHHFYGPTAQGKSWLILWLITEALKRGETVCYFDSENGHRISAQRLDALGLTPEQSARLSYWPDVSLTLDKGDIQNYTGALQELKPDLVIFDAWIYFLTNAGVGENDPDGIVSWCLAYTKPARDMGITTALVDHTGHDETRARGSSRKKQEMDVQWRVKMTAPFNRDTVGEITLYREKDREAWLPEVVKFSAGGTDEGFTFRHSAGTIQDEALLSGLSAKEYQALEALRREPGVGFNHWKHNASEAGVSEGSFNRVARELKSAGKVYHDEEKRYYPKNSHDPSRNPSTNTDNPTLSRVDDPSDDPSETPIHKPDFQNEDYEDYGFRDYDPSSQNGLRDHGITPLIGVSHDPSPERDPSGDADRRLSTGSESRGKL